MTDNIEGGVYFFVVGRVAITFWTCNKYNIAKEVLALNTDGSTQPATKERAGTDVANVASRLFLFGSLIVNTMKQDNMLILASVLNVTALILIRRAAVLEAEEQQIAPGVTTFANNLKLTATPLSLFASLLLLWALLIEVALKQPIVGVAPATTGAGSAGSLFV
jgi:hypothetical protein